MLAASGQATVVAFIFFSSFSFRPRGGLAGPGRGARAELVGAQRAGPGGGPVGEGGPRRRVGPGAARGPSPRGPRLAPDLVAQERNVEQKPAPAAGI